MRPRYRNGFRHHFQSCNTSPQVDTLLGLGYGVLIMRLVLDAHHRYHHHSNPAGPVVVRVK